MKKITKVTFKKAHEYFDKGLSNAEAATLIGVSSATMSRVKSTKTLAEYEQLCKDTASRAAKSVAAPEPQKPAGMIGYKAFDQNWSCRDQQFEVGKTYLHDGDVKLCNSGYHFCENPLDIFQYYPPTSKFAEVEAHGVSDETSNDSKRVAKKLFVKAELSLSSIIDIGVKFILSKIDFSNATESASGYQSAATNTGYRSAATNTGYQSAATNTGYQSAATNTGNYSAATNTGYQSAATIDGRDGVAIVTGYGSRASGKKGCWLVLTERENGGDWKIKEVRAIEVDGKTIKEDTFYKLEGGSVVEA